MKTIQMQKYCPKCKSYNVERKKRGFIRKTVLGFSPLYQCYNCKYSFTLKEFDKIEKNI